MSTLCAAWCDAAFVVTCRDTKEGVRRRALSDGCGPCNNGIVAAITVLVVVLPTGFPGKVFVARCCCITVDTLP